MLGWIVALGVLSSFQETVPPKFLSAEPSSERTIFADFIGLSGRVVLKCGLTVNGALENCIVQEAIPAGAGFERVALDGATHARFSPQIEDGLPVATEISVPFLYKAAPAFAPYQGVEPTPAAVAALKPLARFLVNEGGSGNIVADLPDDRRFRVQGWIDELLPVDPDADVTRIAKRLARTLTSDQIEAIAAGRRPTGAWPDFQTLNSADVPDPRLVNAGAELKRRYCAEFDCRDPFAEDAVASGMGGTVVEVLEKP